ncbi:MAG: dihydroneopterin aldolase [Prevotella sp.]|nr:dihydroneopterin aldolase [Prevotella sp.]MBR6591281.1 dihydroneopterin aldolase [Prevotella sp.]MBR6604966.1 dihydroneopterin aldolase [Prevotella sp.]
MNTYIYLREVRFHANHGVMPQERTVGTDFTVDLRVEYPFAVAMKSDNVDDTLNYAQLYNLVKKEMAQPSRLLEHVAGRIAEAVFREFPSSISIDLCITKVNPPMGADCGGAGVEIHLINDKTI